MGSVYLVCQRPNPRTGKAMARFYRMLIAPTLFGEWALVREWGRIGSSGSVQAELYPNAGAALLALQERTRAILRRGYVSTLTR
jgi:predicted DNA-binding WGR domain protein